MLQVGLTAVRIGQSLSQTEAQRQKAEHAQSLLEFFLAFNDLRWGGLSSSIATANRREDRGRGKGLHFEVPHRHTL